MPRLRHDARALSFSSEMASGIGRGVLTGIRTGIRTGMRTSVRMLATVGGLLALAHALNTDVACRLFGLS